MTKQARRRVGALTAGERWRLIDQTNDVLRGAARAHSRARPMRRKCSEYTECDRYEHSITSPVRYSLIISAAVYSITALLATVRRVKSLHRFRSIRPTRGIYSL